MKQAMIAPIQGGLHDERQTTTIRTACYYNNNDNKRDYKKTSVMKHPICLQCKWVFG